MKKAILISIRPEWVEKILNGEKTIEIRKSMPKCELPIDVYIYCSKGDVNLYREFIQLWNDNNGNNLIKPFYESISYFVDKYHLKEYDTKTSSRKKLNSKVVAKFTLDKADKYQTAYVTPNDNSLYKFTKYGLFTSDDFIYSNDGWLKNEQVEDLFVKSCLNIEDIHKYAKTGKIEDFAFGFFYAWHIENLQIFDKPMELNQFEKYYDEPDDLKPCCNGKHCIHESYDWCENQNCCDIDYDGTNCPYLKVNKAPQSWQYVYVED